MPIKERIRESIRDMLEPGSRLDIGRVWQVVELVDGQPRKIGQLIERLWDENLAVANRAADALERVTRDRPAQAQRWKGELLGLMAEVEEKKLRWNLALVVPRLKLTQPECRRAAGAMRSYLNDPSSILKTAALHGLADLTRQDASLLPEVLDLLRVAGRSGTPAMRARSRILLEKLENPGKAKKTGSSLHMFTWATEREKTRLRPSTERWESETWDWPRNPTITVDTLTQQGRLTRCTRSSCFHPFFRRTLPGWPTKWPQPSAGAARPSTST